METWRKLIEAEMNRHRDSSKVILHTFKDGEEDREFDALDFGSENGCVFTLWTELRVYFPVSYDGRESVGSVSRVPDGRRTRHIRGG